MPTLELGGRIGFVMLAALSALLMATVGLSIVLWRRLRAERRSSVATRPMVRVDLPATSPVTLTRRWPGGPTQIDPRSIGKTVSIEPLATKLIVVPRLGGSGGGVDRSDVAAELERRHTSIWERAAMGRTASQIAAEVDRPLGEVEVVLALRRRLLERRSTEDRA